MIATLLRPIALGAVVRLPDDTLAEVTWSSYSEVHVLHGYLRAAGVSGAGPWIFQRHQVEEATEAEAVSYRTAVSRAATVVVVWSVS